MLLVPRWRVRPWVPIIALCVALAAVAPPVILLSKGKQAPPIHDISTDTSDPPAFEALREAALLATKWRFRRPI
jgi:peptidoglycan/LPS O-acetylase OafA/YrhL